jgi:HNH endonuclease
LVRLCLQLAGHGPHCGPSPEPTPPEPPTAQPAPASAEPSGLDQLTNLSREAIQQAIIGKVADLLSGPGGLASFLRTRQLGARLAGPSLPLDIGYSTSIPPGIRNAVILRDRRCRWPGGCNQPAAACQVHHIQHLANGGPTSLSGCVLLCSFHHQVVIHRWGWTLVLNPDGTTTAWNPGRTKTLHSHGPPARAA